MVPCLEVRDIKKRFEGIWALSEFSCSVAQGELVGLMGPNGSGKTTLLNVISGFVVPDAGTVFFRGVNSAGRSPNRLARDGIARTFQELRLVRQVSVVENVLLCFRRQCGENLANVFFRRRRWEREEESYVKTAQGLLADVGLLSSAKDPAESLSYGQQKLLSLACCLAADAELFLLDEPVAGIAPSMMERILAIIKRLPMEGKSVILIEHNLETVMQVCDRVIFMDAGAKVCEGTPDEVRNDPRVIEAYID